jgi:hypothetical protein
MARSNLSIPETIEEALDKIESDGIAKTKTITVRSVTGERFPRIIGYELGDKPAVANRDLDLEEVPF